MWLKVRNFWGVLKMESLIVPFDYSIEALAIWIMIVQIFLKLLWSSLSKVMGINELFAVGRE
ncbi:MAG: hypothetical protein B0A82_18790 [Alkalinema sp. CACIAM 70d]|nr:MAG: hypothetical protein B0A82_18790 [Alkalinema sp. CACIAM 70d]